ncbi:MAG TPA: ATP-binding cassette domain-containing protein [Gemmatimonadaceae bacterium]
MANVAGSVVAEGLGKRYGDLWALRDVDLHVPSGTILGLLGHNGAGKTTTLRILTTLAIPTTGRASVAGFDVVADAARVRENIGLTAQQATVDGLMTARANLEMIARLYHMPRAVAKTRAGELLERLGIADAADRIVKTFSGGMRRRLDLAASIVASPPVLFLDEPTTGLDPQSRNDLWTLLRELVTDGATLVLTTQYLEEADLVADEIVLLDRGRVTAHGTPAELKALIGGARIVITLADAADLARAESAILPFTDGAPATDAGAVQVSAPLRSNVRLIEVVRALDGAGIDAVDVHRREPTLDDVFLTLTGAPGAAGSAS